MCCVVVIHLVVIVNAIFRVLYACVCVCVCVTLIKKKKTLPFGPDECDFAEQRDGWGF